MSPSGNFFKGKKVTLMRIGLLGRGVGDAAFLAGQGAEVLVVDSAPQDVMQPSVDKLKEYKNIRFKFGPYDLADFRNRDFVLKGAGTPLNSPEIAEAKKHKIPIRMSADLFAELSGISVVGITGTRGKSTVTHLVDHILRTDKRDVILGGNVLGVSNLQLLKKVKKNSIAVMELDSWQLQGFGESKISPHISVFTTFFDDHLNYYKGDKKKYFKDKANIFSNQKVSDVLIIGKQAYGEFKKYKAKTKAKIIIPKPLPKDFLISIPGEHNRYNAALAVEVARNLGVKESVIKKALRTFKGVKGRLELLRVVRGIKYYNDTTSTTPEATIAALKALGARKLGVSKREERKIILIMGGSDKGLDMTKLLKAIPIYCREVILLDGTGTSQITRSLKPKAYKLVSSMKEAVSVARALARHGDTILLSPAFASFGMFKNEFDRGEQFDRIVSNL